tara:strand:+ start:256 stop:396 length:141 start_codon:yes stop_codon:yes gene_type:complete
VAGRWRTFTIVVDGDVKMKRKGWGKHVPSAAEAYQYIIGTAETTGE